MASVDWHRVVADDCALPAGEPLDELSAELTRMLGSPDPVQRDELAHRVLATWIDRGVYDDLLTGLGDGMVVGLTRGLGESGTDSVFRRSFSALVLAGCLDRANRLDLVPAGKVLEWGDRLASWYVRERDLRGFVEGKGWAHAVAHGADGLGVLAGSRHLGAPELTAVLDTLADRVLVPGEAWVHGEPDRVALATLAVLRRDLVPFGVTERWIARVAAAADPFGGETDGDPFETAGNPQAFLRALHVQTVLAPEPPPDRADLLLVLVDALRRTNAAYLG